MRQASGKGNAVKKTSSLFMGAVVIGVIMAWSGFATEAQAYYNVTIGAASAAGSWTGNVWTPSGSGSTVAAGEIESRLGGGPVEITTGSSGSGAETGDITIKNTVTWSASTLTLNARNNLNINRALNGSAAAGLALHYGQGAVAAGNSSACNVHAPVNLAATGSFSTKFGSDGATINHIIITSLGAEGSTTATDLQGMNGNLAGNYVLGADIDASATSGWNSGEGFAPVGASPASKFIGNFDGLGHTVSGLFINRPFTDYQGMVGATGNAILRNVGLTGVNITGYNFVGGLAATPAGGALLNSYVTGTVSGHDGVGGISGNPFICLVTGSYATATVSAIYNVGGLIGMNWVSTVSASHASGNVSGTAVVGGLVGYNNGGSISTSYAIGAVSGARFVGGLVGSNDGAIISDSYATGAVQGDDKVGGFAGHNYGAASVISTSFSSGAVSGNANVGGFIGVNVTSASITSSYWDTGTSGQAAGFGSNTATITNLTGLATADARTQANYANLNFVNTWWMSEGNTRPFLRSEYSTTIGNVHQLQLMGMNLTAAYTLATDIDAAETATAGAGMWGSAGFVPVGTNISRFSGTFDGLGHAVSGLVIDRPITDYVGLFGVTNSVAVVAAVVLDGGSIRGRNLVGGLAGYNVGTLDSAGTSAAIVATGYNAGGLVGQNDGLVRRSWVSGSVAGFGDAIGGLAGANFASGDIEQSYATGATSSDGNNVGGLVGLNQGDGTTVSDSYATGSASGNSAVGGLVGLNMSDSSISGSYATGAVSGVSNGGGLVGVTIAATVTSSFWDTQTSGQATSAGGTGTTTAEMQQLATFNGWDIDDAGGTGTAWRIYEGHTYPLLRSFLTPLTVTADNVSKSYDGVPYSSPLSNPSYSVAGADGSGHLFNLADPYQGAVEIGSYLPGLWSDQPGFDISFIDGLLTISKADQTITFAPLPDRTYGDADFTISATASSGLAVSFVSTTPAVCTVSGTLVSLVAPGICSITASQGGDAHYNPAVDVGRSFMVRATVTPSAGANGSISPPDPQTVAYNGTVAFTIVPATGYHVDAVGGTCGGSYTGDPADSVNGILYTTNAVTVDCTVQASFAINQYSVAAVAGPNGSLDGSTPTPQTIEHGATTRFTFHADTDYYIASIIGCGINYLNGDQSITTRSETTPPITGDCTVNAAFAINTHQLTVIVEGKGRVTADNGGVDCPGTCTGTYDHNTIVILTATPEQGGEFIGWSGDADCEDGIVTMTTDLSCTAEFYRFPWSMFLPAIMKTGLGQAAGNNR